MKGKKGRVNQSSQTMTQEELKQRKAEVQANLHTQTWETLEKGKTFDKNDKLDLIGDDVLLVGCDVGSDENYLRAFDNRGREIGDRICQIKNNVDGFEEALDWSVTIAAQQSKRQIVLALEPTGHYWFSLFFWMRDHGVTVLQVNPYAVKQTKELEDNSPEKNDRKDPRLIANLVKDGNYGVPYLPEGEYATLREAVNFRNTCIEDRIMYTNRLHRTLKIVYPDYQEDFGKIDGKFTLTLLSVAPLPDDLLKLGEDGIKSVWKDAKLKGKGFSRAIKFIEAANRSVVKEARKIYGDEIKSYAVAITKLNEKIESIEEEITQSLALIPNATNLTSIPGISTITAATVVSQIGDISRFSSPSEIQKLAGLGPVGCSSGKHTGQAKISHRGRKALRTGFFNAALSAISHSDEFRELHKYYTTREVNPLKKKQSVVALSCKLIRLTFAVLQKGVIYDPKKMMADIKRDVNAPNAA